MSKNANLLQSFLTVAVGCLAAVTVASLFFNLYLFYICLAVTVVCTAALWWLLRQLKRQVNAVMMAVGQTLTGAQKEAAQTFPVPVLCCDAQGEILLQNYTVEPSQYDFETSFTTPTTIQRTIHETFPTAEAAEGR